MELKSQTVSRRTAVTPSALLRSSIRSPKARFANPPRPLTSKLYLKNRGTAVLVGQRYRSFYCVEPPSAEGARIRAWLPAFEMLVQGIFKPTFLVDPKDDAIGIDRDKPPIGDELH